MPRLKASRAYRRRRRPGTSDRRFLGLDEAGRGSVLGPLVLGGFLCEESRLGEIGAAGTRDSKLLTPRQRSRVYGRLRGIGDARSIALAPRTIDRFVAHGGLNELELRSFATLVRSLAPDVVCVDACDPDAARFGRRLALLAGGAVVVDSRHRADRDVAVVSAASVVAKVRRDAALARLGARAGEVIGSGYPSDPETQACVERHARDGGAIPPWMRRSWATVQRVKRARPARTLEQYGA